MPAFTFYVAQDSSGDFAVSADSPEDALEGVDTSAPTRVVEITLNFPELAVQKITGDVPEGGFLTLSLQEAPT